MFRNLSGLLWMLVGVSDRRSTWEGLLIWEEGVVFGISSRVLLAGAIRLLAKDRDERRIPILTSDQGWHGKGG